MHVPSVFVQLAFARLEFGVCALGIWHLNSWYVCSLYCTCACGISAFAVCAFAVCAFAIRDPTNFASALVQQVLSVVSATWLWCEPWHQPKTLQRVWCLFEALKTLDFGKTLQLTMSATEKESMQETLVNHFDGIMDTISGMDVSRAEATQSAVSNAGHLHKQAHEYPNANVVDQCSNVQRQQMHEYKNAKVMHKCSNAQIQQMQHRPNPNGCSVTSNSN